jgi:hypothetical protein
VVTVAGDGVRLAGLRHDLIAGAASGLRAGRHSRRRFLGVAGALAGALLAGCGRDEARRPPQRDADALTELLRREQAALAAIAAAPGPARALRDQDARHVARLRHELVALGGRVPSAPPPGQPGSAVARKQQALFAYVAALPRLADPGLRVLAMQLAASEAEHLAALRLAAGADPVPDAFAGFAGARPG